MTDTDTDTTTDTLTQAANDFETLWGLVEDSRGIADTWDQVEELLKSQEGSYVLVSFHKYDDEDDLSARACSYASPLERLVLLTSVLVRTLNNAGEAEASAKILRILVEAYEKSQEGSSDLQALLALLASLGAEEVDEADVELGEVLTLEPPATTEA